MASVSRPSVEGCPVRFGFKCPSKWQSLERTDREDIRFCQGCHQNVYFARTVEEARSLAQRDHCVALDPSLVRVEGDLDPEGMQSGMMGRVA